MALELMYITNDLDVALIAEKSGVDRVWIDLETLGKDERQKGMNTVKSKHSVADIKQIAPNLTKARMMVRVNPWNTSSIAEIEEVLAAGAQIVMLPMWKTTEEVQQFISVVNGRAIVSLLLETKEAVACLDEVLRLQGIDEIHIGLNDLHLSLGLTFMFEPLANGLVEMLCGKIGDAGIPYGFGGIARLGAGDIPAEMIIREHYRLHSTRAILSRSFCNADEVPDRRDLARQFKTNMMELREFENKVLQCTSESLEENRQKFVLAVEKVVSKRKGLLV